MSARLPGFRLYLLRHARAGWALPGEKDFDRSLDDAGFAESEIVADMAADRRFVPELTLCSTAVRCRQTAEAFRRAMGEDLDIRYTDALYTGTADVYRAIIAGQDDISSLMVIGHNPVIEEILREILGEGGTETIPNGYPPGALAVIDLDTPPSGGILPTGRLVDWLDPEAHMQEH